MLSGAHLTPLVRTSGPQSLQGRFPTAQQDDGFGQVRALQEPGVALSKQFV